MKDLTFLKPINDYVVISIENQKSFNFIIEAIKIKNGCILDRYKKEIDLSKDYQKEINKFRDFIKDKVVVCNNFMFEKFKKTLNLTFDNYFINWSSLLEVLRFTNYKAYSDIPKNYLELKNPDLFIPLNEYKSIKNYIKEQLSTLQEQNVKNNENYKTLNDYIIFNISFVMQDNYFDIYKICAFKIEDSNIVDIFYKILKPTNKLDMKNNFVITDKILKNAPTFEQVKNEFFELIKDKTIISNIINISLLNKFGANIKDIVDINLIIKTIFKDKFLNSENISEFLKIKNDFISPTLEHCINDYKIFEKLKQF
jgi:hypothetical protein